MTPSASPALIACLYSLIVVCAALLMGLQKRVDDDGIVTAPYRITGISLSVVAVLLPLVRLVGTRNISDVMLLVGAMAAGVAAAVSLIKNNPSALDVAEEREAAQRTAARRARTRRARTDVLPVERFTPQRDDASVYEGQLVTAPTDARRRSDVTSVDLAVSDALAHIHEQTQPQHAGPTERASHTLHIVDETVDDVAKRLRLN